MVADQRWSILLYYPNKAIRSRYTNREGEKLDWLGSRQVSIFWKYCKVVFIEHRLIEDLDNAIGRVIFVWRSNGSMIKYVLYYNLTYLDRIIEK